MYTQSKQAILTILEVALTNESVNHFAETIIICISSLTSFAVLYWYIK